MDSNIIMEILTWCPIDNLDQCKSVCKQWKNLTYESIFIQLHLRRTSTISGYFIQGMRHCKFIFKFVSMDDNDNSRNISLNFLPNDIQICAASDQGLLCFITRRYKKSRFHICKPTTQQLWALPNPRLRYHTEKVALVVLGSNPLRFKIVRLSAPRQLLRNNHNYHCEVFHSDPRAWKRKDDLLLPPGVFLIGSAISACGTIYWRTNEDSVLAFDVTLEIGGILSGPEQIREDDDSYKFKRLTKYEGRLAFILETHQNTYEILVMKKENKEPVWERRTVISMEDSIKKDYPYFCPNPIAFSSVDIALMTRGNHDAIFYKFPHHIVKKESLDAIKDVFAFRSDFD